MALVQRLLDNSNIKNIVEIGFGDNTIASKYSIPEGKKYIGYELSKMLLFRPNTPSREIRLIRNIRDVKETGDLLIAKEVIHHWPNEDIKYFLD